ncbi:MAG: thiol:disulfide interchange protein, partial [Sphingobacteriales bacterium]
MRKFSLILILFLTANVSSWAQFGFEPHAKWSTKSKKTAPNEYDLIFTATLEKGWHIYSYKVKDENLMPPEFTLKPGKFVKSGNVKEEGKLIRKVEKVGKEDLELLYYEGKASFIEHVKLTGDISKIDALIYYSVCDESSCTPPEEVEFSFPVTFDKNAVAENIDQAISTEKPSGTLVPAPGVFSKVEGLKQPTQWKYTVKSLGNDEYELHFTADIEKGWHIYGMEKMLQDGPTPTTFSFAKNENIQLLGDIIPVTKPVKVYDSVFKQEIYKIEDKAEFLQKIKVLKPLEKITGNLVYMTCNDAQCIPGDADFAFNISDKKAPEITETTVSPAKTLLLSIFGQGFVGGLLALLTPCVFPMIPLTVSFFTKKGSKKKTSGIASALLFGLSIIGIYVSLGFLITIIFGAEALNDIASNIYLNIVFFSLFFIFALSFLGAFEITLPSSWANKADERSEKGGLIGIFFMAFTLAIVSFSCTGVIIGSLLVEATKGGYSGPITGMLGFAIALALPFTLFAIFPSWMQSLPKSGGWLNSVKVVLGFLELALAFKFLSTADLIG